MTARNSTFFLLCMAMATLITIHGCCAEKGNAAKDTKTPSAETHLSRRMPLRTHSPRPYGKMTVPAELFVDLIQPERNNEPVSIIVSATSAVPASAGTITLKVPDIGTQPGRAEVLWAGAPSDFIAEAHEHLLPPLPVGRYKIVAILEFTPDRENAAALLLSKSLYLDVKTDRVASSNVSFRQIDRLELYRELEERVLRDLNPGLAAADSEAIARYRDLIEAVSPGLITYKIAELQTADADIARRIREMNRTEGLSREGDVQIPQDPSR